MKLRSHRALRYCCIVVALMSVSIIAINSQGVRRPQDAKTPREWSHYGGDMAFTRYSPLDQINRNNVKNLKIAWRKPGVNPELTARFPQMQVSAYNRGTPIIFNGTLYVPNAVGLVIALDPETGRTKWEQKPFDLTDQEARGASTRGVDIWPQGGRIITQRGHWLYALNAETGAIYDDFGDHGRTDLNRNTPFSVPFNMTLGPIVVGDVIVLPGNGGGGGDSNSVKKEAAPEDIRGYDVRTGKQLWTFHVVPKPGEFGADTWDPEYLKVAGDLGGWAPMSADEELGYVYIGLSVNTAAFYGGHRPGNNLFAACLVALDAKTGKLVWHYQMIHHDLWEYDNISPSTLGDITVNGKRIKAVMQANKNGFLFVLDRVTGKPVWPIEERPVPQSTVPGEHTSPTQPFPTKPPALDRQGVTDDDLIDFTPALKAQAREILKSYVHGPMFTPGSLVGDGNKGTYFLPGNWGASNWHTGAFDPETGMYYATSGTFPGVYDLVVPKNPAAQIKYEALSKGRIVPDIDGLPLVKPPYGRITALNLNTGEKAWMVANGDGPRNHPLLKDLNLPPLGIPNRPVALLTKTLLFVGEGSNAMTGAQPFPWSWGKKFRAYDKATGQVISEIELPSGTTAGPMTYMFRGKQYIVVAVGDKDTPPEFVALSLP